MKVGNGNANSCHHCKNVFNTQSKPSICKSCGGYIHKKSIKDHSRVCRTTSVVSLGPPVVTPKPVKRPSPHSVRSVTTFVPFLPLIKMKNLLLRV